MEHREEMNCGGDLCKEMLELDKLLRASDSEEMMGYTYNWVCSAFDNLLLLTCKNRCDIYISTSVFYINISKGESILCISRSLIYQNI